MSKDSPFAAIVVLYPRYSNTAPPSYLAMTFMDLKAPDLFASCSITYDYHILPRRQGTFACIVAG